MTATYSKDSPETIRSMFDAIAKNYERGNAFLSFYTYRLWNRALQREIYKNHHPEVLLDLCAGTGEIILPFLKREIKPKKATLLDFSGGMLDVAKEKAKKMALSQHELHFLQADAEKIPLPDNSIDAVTVAYGIRNIKHPLNTYLETWRVLKTGGRFGILELTCPTLQPLKFFHHLYLKTALPCIGKWITSDKEAYRYLCNSIHEFVSPEQVLADLKKAGFKETNARPLMGGVATLFTAKKQ